MVMGSLLKGWMLLIVEINDGVGIFLFFVLVSILLFFAIFLHGLTVEGSELLFGEFHDLLLELGTSLVQGGSD